MKQVKNQKHFKNTLAELTKISNLSEVRAFIDDLDLVLVQIEEKVPSRSRNQSNGRESWRVC